MHYAQPVRNAVGVGEIRDDLCNVEDIRICEPGLAQPCHVLLDHGPWLAGELDSIIEHRPVGLRQRCGLVIVDQLLHQPAIANESAKTFAVVNDSVLATVDRRNYRANHLTLDTREPRPTVHERLVNGEVRL
jgi:hypothetical protein